MLQRTREKLAAAAPLKIVCYGDSISEVGRTPNYFGGASCAAMNWGQQLGRLLHQRYPKSAMTVEHFAVGGQNTYEALGRLDWLAPFAPDLVLLELGSNDTCHHPLPPECTGKALACLIDGIRARHQADVLVVGIGGDNPRNPVITGLEGWQNELERVAREKQAPFANPRPAVLAATEHGQRWEQFHRGEKDCHPNDEGMALWAQVVLEQILATLSAMPLDGAAVATAARGG